jgi:hypothetical protein
MKSVLAIDPGESTGWVFRNVDGKLSGGVVGMSHARVWELLVKYAPDVIILERFNLFPGKAAAQSYSNFYTVEVIGVVKVFFQLQASHGSAIELYVQAPSDKKYAGSLDGRYELLRAYTGDHSEHMKDAYQHLQFYERRHERRERDKCDTRANFR